MIHSFPLLMSISNLVGATRSTQVLMGLRCPAGTVPDFTAETWCRPCSFGTFNPTPGGKTCQPCPAGKFGQVEAGSSEAAACKICGPAQRPDRMSAAAACTDCPLIAGRYGDAI